MEIPTMEPLKKSNLIKEVDLGEPCKVPANSMIFADKVYTLPKHSFTLDKKHMLAILEVPTHSGNTKLQAKIHFKHILHCYILNPNVFDGGVALAVEISEFAIGRLFGALSDVGVDRKNVRMLSIYKYLLFDVPLNWRKDEQEITRFLLYFDAAHHFSDLPLDKGLVTLDELKEPTIIYFLNKAIFSGFMSQAKAKIKPVQSRGYSYVHFDTHVPEPELVTLDDEMPMEPALHETGEGFVVRDRKKQVQITLKEETMYHPCERLFAIANHEWLSGDDVDFQLDFYFKLLLTPEQQEKVMIKQMKFFLDLNMKGSVEKPEKMLIDDVNEIVLSDLPLKSMKDAGQEFDKDFVVVPVIFKEHWFVTVIVNPGASIHEMRFDGSLPDHDETKRTTILVMDSLKDFRALSIDDGDGIFNLLTSYLASAKDKCDKFTKTSKFNRGLVKKIMVQVPQQPNAIDCGVYLVKFIEHFFKNLPDPDNLPTDLTEPEPEMFKDFDASKARDSLFRNVCDLMINYEIGQRYKNELQVISNQHKEGNVFKSIFYPAAGELVALGSEPF